MRQREDMPPMEFTEMPTLEIVGMPTIEIADMKPVKHKNKPVYQEWGFWLLLIVSIVISFASGIMIRTGGSFFG